MEPPRGDALRPPHAVHYGLLNAHPEFTLNFLPPAMRPALDLCGSRSGRDTDKWAGADLVPEPSETVAVPRVAGQIWPWSAVPCIPFDLDPACFLDPALESHYPKRGLHRAYIGQVTAAWASDRFAAP